MNRNRSLTFVLALACIIIGPSIAMAMPFGYAVSGSTPDKLGNILQITGEMHIDDQLRTWIGGEPASLSNLTGGAYQYSITDFTLNVGKYFFSGDGSLYMQVVGSSPENLATGDLMWTLNGTGSNSQWDKWIGEHFYFYNANFQLENPFKEFTKLSDVIEMNNFMYLINDPILPEYSSSFDMWLVRNDSIPSPEPSTLALLGASLTGILIRRKRARM